MTTTRPPRQTDAADDELLAEVRDGAWLDAQVFPTLNAAELVAADKACSSACLVAAGEEATGCMCRCDGAFHGVLAGIPVPGSGPECPEPPDGPDDPGRRLVAEVQAFLARAAGGRPPTGRRDRP